METSDRHHFTLLGIPVQVAPLFWVVTLILGAPSAGASWTPRAVAQLAIWIFAVFVSVLWHELGHAQVMRRFGYAPSVRLYGMGGVTSWNDGPRHPSPKVRLLVSLAGPAAGLTLGGVVWLASLAVEPGAHWALTKLVATMIWVNVGWSLCNLAPMTPWDGGLALTAVLDHFTGGKGRKPAAIVTLVVGAIVAVWLVSWGAHIWLLFLVGLSIASGARALRSKPAAGADSGDPIEQARDALDHVTIETRARAILLADRRSTTDELLTLAARTAQLAAGVGAAETRADLLEVAAWCYLLGGDVTSGAVASEQIRAVREPPTVLVALVAARKARPNEALSMLSSIADEEARRLIEITALLALGRHDEALASLRDDLATGQAFEQVLFYDERFEDAAALGAGLFARFAHPSDAYNTACSYARAGCLDEASSWLARAIDAGYDDAEHLEADSDLDAIRHRPSFAALLDRMRSRSAERSHEA